MLVALNTLSAALHAFKEFTQQPDVQIQTVQTFLVIAAQGNPGVDELARQIGLTQAAASRNLKKLREGPHGQEGYSLITMTLDPLDNRRRITKLTARGHELVRHLEGAMLPPIRSHVIRELMKG
ncbi:DNA-binding MarR family transcriptional regulator [Nitrosospira sp. Nsp2]|uniref:MarR family winged helix-turn-helix transcriptional regulator n=1 Tax=Nitrosospira sp. Nsp2 TaxID=136548 RepID=UPI000D319BBB|nr:MarR family winged helix-turn-helix transcriptional regulator [Nitrosospira sp. Nsp2]PTR15077.1 DNA-binding MarR family transcriptional regulator [Nitrosospira sp. Nsp2]